MTRLAAVCALAVLLAGGGPQHAVGHVPGRQPAARTAAAPRAAAPPAASGNAYAPPVTPLHVLRGFEPPPTPYAAGHRGVDLATAADAVVRAAGAGRVSFAGSVAGRGVVVIVHPDGLSTEYEPVTASVHAGAAVARGQPIGAVHGTHGSCPANRCLHWGARRGGAYFDPLSLLRPLGPVRLLPWT
jgi:murein DD-endopeptidase MepM/ murein hydrolase activator NlpD